MRTGGTPMTKRRPPNKRMPAARRRDWQRHPKSDHHQVAGQSRSSAADMETCAGIRSKFQIWSQVLKLGIPKHPEWGNCSSKFSRHMRRISRCRSLYGFLGKHADHFPKSEGKLAGCSHFEFWMVKKNHGAMVRSWGVGWYIMIYADIFILCVFSTTWIGQFMKTRRMTIWLSYDHHHWQKLGNLFSDRHVMNDGSLLRYQNMGLLGRYALVI